jgi:uncharacterized protein YdiU (UPF0061 family)
MPHEEITPTCERGICVVLGQLSLANDSLQALRVDSNWNKQTRQVFNATVTPVLPTPFRAKEMRVVALDPAVALLLGLQISKKGQGPSDPPIAEYLSGRQLLPGSQPYAHCYGGHQFGYWNGQLGDGRAISIGHVMGYSLSHGLHGDRLGKSAGNESSSASVRRKTVSWEVALKGAGRTPYSRAGDGRAVLLSACREFLGSTALLALGVPSTRALGVVAPVPSSSKEAWSESRFGGGGRTESNVVSAEAYPDAIFRDEWYKYDVQARVPGTSEQKHNANARTLLS